MKSMTIYDVYRRLQELMDDGVDPRTPFRTLDEDGYTVHVYSVDLLGMDQFNNVYYPETPGTINVVVPR